MDDTLACKHAITKLALGFQISERIEQMLHVKSEDLRLYDLTNEDSPVLLEEENSTIENLYVNAKNRPKDGYKLLIESRCHIIILYGKGLHYWFVILQYGKGVCIITVRGFLRSKVPWQLLLSYFY